MSFFLGVSFPYHDGVPFSYYETNDYDVCYEPSQEKKEERNLD